MMPLRLSTITFNPFLDQKGAFSSDHEIQQRNRETSDHRN